MTMRIREWLDDNVMKRKGTIYLCAFLLPFLMMQVFWALNGIYPYGDNSILTGDMDLEFINFYGYFINTFRSKSDWTYMLAKTMGGDFPGLAAFQLHDPLLFILFFFPGEKLAAGIELLFTLQVSLAGLSMSCLLNSRYKRSAVSLLFSTAYAFSGFFFGYLVLTIYFGCLALLPLLVLFFLKYLDDRRYLVPYTLSAILYIYMNFHMGFMLVIFLCIIFISRIISDGKYIGRIWDFVLSGIAILLTDGFFLIRTGLSLLGEKTTEGADYGFYRRFAINQVFAGFFTGCSKNENVPLIYCSLAVVLFALVFLVSGQVRIREKLACLFTVGTVIVSMWINTLDAVWHGFNNPEGFYFRYAYLVSFMVIVIGYRGALLLFYEGDAGGYEKVLPVRIIFAGFAMFLYMAWLRISGNVYLDGHHLIINAVLVSIIILCALLNLKKGTIQAFAMLFLFLISAGDMLYNSKTAYINLNGVNGGLPKMSRFRDDYKNIEDVISYIKDTDDGFYRIEKDFDRAVNDPALFDYIGLSHDSSCEKDEIIDWLANFGFGKTQYYTYYNGGGTSFTDAFFGIRYYVSRFDDTLKPYEHLPYQGKYHVFKDTLALPLAYASPGGLSEYAFENGNVFTKQNDLASFWGSRDIYIEADSELGIEGANEEGQGRYTKTSDEAYLVYSIPITCEMPLYLYFEAPSRQGAELIINGEDRGRYFSETHWNVVCAGIYKPGDTVEVRLKLLGDLEISDACFYYEDIQALKEWADKAEELNRPVGDVYEIKSSHLKLDVNGDDAKQIIMSIPYDSGWHVTCDGKRIDTGRALKVLMAYEVPGGDHTIEMKYVPHGTAAGLIVSCAGLIMLIVLCLRTYSSRYRSIRPSE